MVPQLAGALEVFLQPAVGLVDAGLHFQVGHPRGDLVLRHALQQGHRIVVNHPPIDGLQLAEDGADIRLPGPPQVLGQLAQLPQRVVFHLAHSGEYTAKG